MLRLEAVHKRRPHKIAKNGPPSPHTHTLIRTGSTLPCPEVRKIRSFLRQIVLTSVSEETPLLVRKMSALDKSPSPLTADAFYGRPL